MPWEDDEEEVDTKAKKADDYGDCSMLHELAQPFLFHRTQIATTIMFEVEDDKEESRRMTIEVITRRGRQGF